jgi:MFS family permease
MRSIGILVAAGGMALIRASVGLLTFHLLFYLRATFGLGALGVAIAGGALGSVLGNLAAPGIRRKATEELMLIGSLALIAVTGLVSALIGGLGSAVVLSFSVNAAASVGRMSFESIVQRDAPDANQGRVFAQYESRFQLSWVLAGVLPVLFILPGQIGFLIVGLIGLFGTVSAVIGARAERAGRPLPPTLTARARQTLRKEVDRRRRARAADDRQPLPPGSPLPPPRPGQKRR